MECGHVDDNRRAQISTASLETPRSGWVSSVGLIDAVFEREAFGAVFRAKSAPERLKAKGTLVDCK